MNDIRLFPRLPLPAARARMAQISGVSVKELSALASVENADAVYPATGGRRVSSSEISEIRSLISDCASSLGFPKELRDEEKTRFDSTAAALLHSIPISAGEAARDEVWSFLTLVVLPDVACWRFPRRHERRLLGGGRNTFQRLWWRAHLLRDVTAADEWHLLRLPEDALVGFMERPAISSNPAVAVAIARMIEHLSTTVGGSSREDAWRDAYKRIRQRYPLVNPDALGAAELAEQLAAIEQETIRFIRSAPKSAKVTKGESVQHA